MADVVTRRALAAGVLAVLLAACGVSSQDQAVQVDRDSVPFHLLDRAQDEDAQGSQSVEIYLVAPNGLVALQRPLTGTPTPAAALRELERPASGPDLGLVTAVPADSVTYEGTRNGLATVQLDEALVTDKRLPIQLVAQVVLTLTQFPSVTRVEFVVDGDRIDVPRGDGSLTSSPVTRSDYRTLLVSG